MSECSDFSDISDFETECSSLNIDISNGSPININNFIIVHYNINSVLATDRIEQLSDYCKTLNIDVLILTESKLDETIPDNLLTIPGYHEPVRRDRAINGRYGGGVLIYISESLVFQNKPEFQSENFEHLWVDVRINNTIFAINAFYRPPKESQEDHQKFLNTADNILSKLRDYDKAKYKIIASDLNFGNCYSKMPILNHKPLDSAASDLFSSHGFQQLIDIPTRFTINCISLIDLIFVNESDDVVCHGTLPRIADHEGVLVSFNIESKKQKPKTKIIYDYKNADIIGLTKYIKEFDFDNTVFSKPTVNQTDIYSEILKNAFAQFVQPWANNYTRLLLRKKNRNYLFYKKCELDYRNCLNTVNARPEIVTRF